MSYGATVSSSAANSYLIEFLTPGLNKFFVHCDFSKWFIDNLKYANEFKFVFLLLLIFTIHTQWTCYPSKSNSFIGLFTCIFTVML